MARVSTGIWHMIDEIDLVAMVANHASLGLLCDRLEEIADTLPRLPAPSHALEICRELEHGPATHEAHERALLARLFGTCLAEPSHAALLQHIRNRSGSRAVQAQDLIAALQPADGSLPASTLGYMLRSFFEGCRTDMPFEELAILQIAGERLTADARALLQHSIEARCRA
jgi:hypothetical protein